MNTLPRLKLPLAPGTLLALALAFALPGLIGHDPWKTEDAIGTGLVHQMLAHGQWLIPHLAGEPYFDDGPLHYWIASAIAWVASPLLSVHDGARLASGAMIVAALFFLRSAARDLCGRIEGEAAMLALLGSLGLLVHAHENLGENALLAACALSFYAMALARRRARPAGILLGIGIACAFFAKGIGAALIPALTALLLGAIAGHWRRRSYLVVLAIAIACAAALSGAWIAAAWQHSPALLRAWLGFQLAAFGMPGGAMLADYGSTLSWSAWPAWPIALWAVWASRRRSRPMEAGIALPLTGIVVAALVLAFTRDVREVNALPLLLPMAMLAGAGVPLLRRGAANALAWFGAMTFGFLGALVWLGWFAMMTGTPATIARNFAKLEPGFVPQFGWIAFGLALIFTAAWLLLVFHSERSPLRSVLFWSGGTAMLWGLIMILLLPWIDYGKTYRPVALAIKRALPAGAQCIESRGLGESQRAAFDYHAGIVTRRAEIPASARARCPVLLVQARPGEDDRHLGSGWKRIWEGSRPRDRERYRLYVRTR